MAIHSATVLNPGSERPNIRLSSGQTVLNFHGDGDCLGDFCPVHKPSEHSLRDLPLAFTGNHMVRIVSRSEISDPHGIYIPDYADHSVLVAIDPDDYIFRAHGKAIIRNSGSCPHCGDHIVSYHGHDYRSCSCGKSAVDGGTNYLRRSGDVIETSIVFYTSDSEDED